MPSNELQVSVASNRGTWIRTVLWLVGLALLFLVFAQLATGSDLLWNDSTLLVAASILSVALFVVLSRARAQGIDARKTFLMLRDRTALVLADFRAGFRPSFQLGRKRIQGELRRAASVPASCGVGACRFCASFDDLRSTPVSKRNVLGSLQVGFVVCASRSGIGTFVFIAKDFPRMGIQARTHDPLATGSCGSSMDGSEDLVDRLGIRS